MQWSTDDILRFPTNRSLPLILEEEAEKEPIIENKPPAVQQLDGTDSEWRYRGRTENESAEPQPISAPPGLVAQKDEGFQRFYKAVVSPTHVRVTAGGRIVPNTRISSSPTSKWSKEKPMVPGLMLPRSLDRDTSESASTNGIHTPFAAFPSMYPGYAPAMGSPYPMFPWHMYNAFCLPTAMNPALNPKSLDREASRNQQDGVDDRQDRSTTPDKAHNQNDQTRPVYFNGQWPMQPNPSLFPYGMPAMPGFPHPSMVAPIPTSSAPPISTSSASAPAKMDKTAETTKVASSATPATNSLANPPISSIRPSEITKKQIDVLRGSLKYLEDQLLYNKHQIDEKWMEYQAQMVRQQVQQFEKNLENQKSFEESHYPKQKEDVSSSSDRSASQHAASPNCTVVGHDLAHDRFRRDKDTDYTRFNHGINSTKSVSLFAPKTLSAGYLASSDPSKKSSKLPVNAALAPPFQPQIEPASFNVVSAAMPYLVGILPAGLNPSKASESGYQYARDLTDDELRARHMYWGKAPQHLQKGLPKFDGKDFYPPSPVRDRTSESASSLPDIQTESVGTRSTAGSIYDPFRSLGRPRHRTPRNALGQITQSEALQQSETCDSSSIGSIAERGTSCTGKIGRNYEDFRKALDSSSNVAKVPSKAAEKSEDDEDARSIVFKGRKPAAAAGYVHHSRCWPSANLYRTKSRNDIWQSMLNKGKSSGQVAPSTISSATAQGVLPQYRGHATAYLTPTIANTTMPVRPLNANGKAVESGDLMSFKPQDGVQPENLPPAATNENDSMHQGSLQNYNTQGILSQ